MRALIVTNMYPTPAGPALGSFVARPGRGAARASTGSSSRCSRSRPAARRYVRAARGAARAATGAERFDVVHAHFGLTAWPALAARGARPRGDPARHRPRAIRARGRSRSPALPRSTSSPPCPSRWRATVPALGGAAAGAPSCPAASTCSASARSTARRGPRRAGPRPRAARACCSPPTRPAPRSATTARWPVAGDVALLTLGDVAPADVPLWVNAANAVLVPSEREGFGLAVLEALACDVPVLATPVGIAPRGAGGRRRHVLRAVRRRRWRAALAPHLAGRRPAGRGPRARRAVVDGPDGARRVLEAWRGLLGLDRAATGAAAGRDECPPADGSRCSTFAESGPTRAHAIHYDPPRPRRLRAPSRPGRGRGATRLTTAQARTPPAGPAPGLTRRPPRAPPYERRHPAEDVHRRRHRARQRVEGVAALEHRPDRHAELVGHAAQRPPPSPRSRRRSPGSRQRVVARARRSRPRPAPAAGSYARASGTTTCSTSDRNTASPDPGGTGRLTV